MAYNPQNGGGSAQTCLMAKMESPGHPFEYRQANRLTVSSVVNISVAHFTVKFTEHPVQNSYV